MLPNIIFCFMGLLQSLQENGFSFFALTEAHASNKLT
jgi:hypothetical protein